MLLVTGEIERVTTRMAGREPNQWEETTLVVKDWGQTLYVTTARDFGPLPGEGERVALDVSVRAYVKRDDTSKAGHGFTAFRRNAEVESLLYSKTSASV